MRVGILTAEINPGSGWANLSLNTIAALRDQGVEVRVAAAQGTSGVDLAVLPRLADNSGGVLIGQLRALPALRKTFRDCDVVHTLVEPFAVAGALTAGRRPHILTANGTYAALPQMRAAPVGTLYRWAFRRSMAQCISHYTESVYKQGVPDGRTKVINLGVDASALMLEVRGIDSFTRRAPTVLFVGGVKRRKGTLELVQAMAKVRQQIPQACAVIIGSLEAEPAYVDQIRAEIQALGLAHAIKLTGHLPREEVLRWYRTADVFCVPSMNVGWRFEGYGLVHLEAGAFGLPVIGTRECGAGDAIDDGKTGLLVSQANIAEELPQALLRLLTDMPLRARMGAAGAEKAQRQSWAYVAGQLVELYRSELFRRKKR